MLRSLLERVSMLLLPSTSACRSVRSRLYNPAGPVPSMDIAIKEARGPDAFR